jgi:5'-nucleotidase
MAKRKPLILLTNDDGVRAAGIKALYKEISEIGNVYIFAPDREQSGTAHSLTLMRPLRVNKVSEREYEIDGTPTDCVMYGILGKLVDRKPDLLISGINMGTNLGDDITYSGTVSAALEGTILGVPSLAVSSVNTEPDSDFRPAAKIARLVAENILDKGLMQDTLLNVNVPDLPYGELKKRLKVTRQGKKRYREKIIHKIDPRGKGYFWIGADGMDWENAEDSDCKAVLDGYVSITPLHLDLTNHSVIDMIKSWEFKPTTRLKGKKQTGQKKKAKRKTTE